MPKYIRSQEFINWASQVSAYCTQVKTKHHGIGQLVQDKEWDRDKTELALTLLKGLKKSVAKMEKELRDHVNGTY